MEAAVLWKAAMKPRLSTGLGKRRWSRRFPQLPQPLLLEKEIEGANPKPGDLLVFKTVLDVSG